MISQRLLTLQRVGVTCLSLKPFLSSKNDKKSMKDEIMISLEPSGNFKLFQRTTITFLGFKSFVQDKSHPKVQPKSKSYQVQINSPQVQKK